MRKLVGHYFQISRSKLSSQIFSIFQIYFLLKSSKKRSSPPSLPTMASKVDSRLIKSVVFRPAPQWRAADRVTICHLGEATKTALTISLDPPWTQSTRTSRCLNTCSRFNPFPLFFLSTFSDQRVIIFDWLLCVNDIFGISIPFLILHDTSRYRSEREKSTTWS